MGIENYTQLQARATDTVRAICADSKEEQLLFVCHGAWLRALLCGCLQIPLRHRMRFAVDNACFFVVEFDKENAEFNIVCMNARTV